jgi:hypothetical protein
MANTHLLALVLAGSLHIYFLLLGIETKKRVTDIFLHVIIGIFIFIPSLYFIFPPSDSSIATGIMQEGFGVQQLGLMSKIPLRVFLPIPAWWEPHFWNTQFLLEWQQGSPILKTLSLFLSVLTLVIAYYILKESKKALAVFLINLCLTLAIGVLFPLTTTRYIGFIFIGFVVAYWLYCNEGVPSGKNKILLSILLSFQIIAGLFAVVKDMVLPFSNASKVSTLYAKIPKNEKVVTDYWAVNTVSAFTNKKLYTLGINKEVSFLLWNEEMKVSAKSSYINSLNKLFDAENIMMIYLISGYPLEWINELDPLFTEKFNVELVDKAEGSIEKWSDIYLYKISRR